jgi:MFS family permease
MIFFFSLADGILMYLLPLMITHNGYSKTAMGLIIGSSSMFGAMFDIFLSRYIRKPHYRRLYLCVLLLCALYGVLLYGASSIVIYLLAMATWGMYWDLFNFGNSDFVSRTTEQQQHASTFGILGVFNALGNLVAPLMAGLLIVDVLDIKPFIIFGLLLAISGVFYVVSLSKQPLLKIVKEPSKPLPLTWITEFRLWKKIGRQLLPLLVLLLLIFTTNALFWTIGPLVAEQEAFGSLGGILLMLYVLPGLFTGWFVGRVTNRFGKKRTALYAFLAGSAVLTLFSFATHPTLALIIVGLASFFLSFALPSINGALADYISESKEYEKEIQALSDFFYNIGWIIGPVAGGYLADKVGNIQTFSLLGLFGVVVSVILLKTMPKKIHLKL